MAGSLKSASTVLRREGTTRDWAFSAWVRLSMEGRFRGDLLLRWGVWGSGRSSGLTWHRGQVFEAKTAWWWSRWARGGTSQVLIREGREDGGRIVERMAREVRSRPGRPLDFGPLGRRSGRTGVWFSGGYEEAGVRVRAFPSPSSLPLGEGTGRAIGFIRS
jgi:hypothetical protein